jgi:hypothetical protein
VEADAATVIAMDMLDLVKVVVVIGVVVQEDDIIMVTALGQEHQGVAEQVDQQMRLVQVLVKMVLME